MSSQTPSLDTVSLGERIEKKPSRMYTQNFKNTAVSESSKVIYLLGAIFTQLSRGFYS